MGLCFDAVAAFEGLRSCSQPPGGQGSPCHCGQTGGFFYYWSVCTERRVEKRGILLHQWHVMVLKGPALRLAPANACIFLAWDVSTSQARCVFVVREQGVHGVPGVRDRWRGGEKPAPAKLASCLTHFITFIQALQPKLSAVVKGAKLWDSRTWLLLLRGRLQSGLESVSSAGPHAMQAFFLA